MHRNDEQILRILAGAKLEGDGWMYVLDIWKKSRNRLGFRLSSGSIYVSLARLESDELVESKWKDETAPYPRRRVYRITEKGHHERAKLPVRERKRWLAPGWRPQPEGA